MYFKGYCRWLLLIFCRNVKSGLFLWKKNFFFYIFYCWIHSFFKVPIIVMLKGQNLLVGVVLCQPMCFVWFCSSINRCMDALGSRISLQLPFMAFFLFFFFDFFLPKKVKCQFFYLIFFFLRKKIFFTDEYRPGETSSGNGNGNFGRFLRDIC